LTLPAGLPADAARHTFGTLSAVVGIANGGRQPAARIAVLLETLLPIVGARHNPTDAPYTQSTARVEVDPASIPDADGLRG
jgi:hypothetical protein